MDIQKAEALITQWHALTDAVILLQEIDTVKLQMLFKDTFAVLEGLRELSALPKPATKLLLEVTDFSWYVNITEQSPLHKQYKAIAPLVTGLRHCVFGCDFEASAIEDNLKQLVSE